MPTTDERREVAARLRDFESLRPVFKDSNICGFLEALGVGYMDWKGICDRLADLIEPEPERTCRNEATGSDFKCSECGCSVVGSAYWTEANICNGDWNFCPNCGAKVVE